MSSCSSAHANDMLQCFGKNQDGEVSDSEVEEYSGKDKQSPKHEKVETGKLHEEDRE